eukprot:COSAG02_NODE_8_length_60691_cov_104.994752_35_plen_55_part_00
MKPGSAGFQFCSLGSGCKVTGDGSNATYTCNGPDQGQPLAAAEGWSTDGTQREP